MPEVENSLVVTGATPSTISWGGPSGRFNVYRGILIDSWFYNQRCLDPNTAGPSVDADVPSAGSFFFYLVSRRDPCGQESVLGRDSSGNPIPSAVSCP